MDILWRRQYIEVTDAIESTMRAATPFHIPRIYFMLSFPLRGYIFLSSGLQPIVRYLNLWNTMIPFYVKFLHQLFISLRRALYFTVKSKTLEVLTNFFFTGKVSRLESESSTAGNCSRIFDFIRIVNVTI